MSSSDPVDRRPAGWRDELVAALFDVDRPDLVDMLDAAIERVGVDDQDAARRRRCELRTVVLRHRVECGRCRVCGAPPEPGTWMCWPAELAAARLGLVSFPRTPIEHVSRETKRRDRP